MNELQAVGAVAAGLKPAINLAQTLLDLVGTGKGRKEALELYGQIVSAHQGAMAAQEAQTLLIKEKQALEAELARFETWDRQKERYELKPMGEGSFVYAVKESERGGEPPHTICPNCYEHGRRSILQSTGIGRQSGTERLHCLACEATITVSHGAIRNPSGPRRLPWAG